jgi:hypothetical protein
MATNESEKEMPASNFQWPEYSKSSAPTPGNDAIFLAGNSSLSA